MEIIYLYIYAILQAVIIAHAIRHKKSKMYIFIWTCYFVSAVFCILCKTFQDTLVGRGGLHDEWYNLSDTTLWGYLLIIICNLVAFKPFERYTTHKFIDNYGKRSGDYLILKYTAYGFLFLFFLYLATSANVIVGAFAINDYGALRNALFNNVSHESTAVMSANVIGRLCFKVCWNLKLIVVFCGFVLISKKKKALGFLLLACDFALVIIQSQINASRGGLLIFLFCALLCAIPIIEQLPKNIKRYLFILACGLAALVVSFILAVSISRLADNTSGGNLLLQNISFYLGHGPIIFSKLTGTLEKLGFGEVIFSRLGNHFFEFPYRSVSEIVGYPKALNNLFYTYLGPTYMDFGTLGSIVFYAFWARAITHIMKESRVRLSTVYMFSYYVYFFVSGVFVISPLEFAALITTLLVGILFRLIENTIYNRQRHRGQLYIYQENPNR